MILNNIIINNNSLNSSPVTDKILNCNSTQLVLSSINANNSFRSNLSFYLDFILRNNIDILFIQEPGSWISFDYSQHNGPDTKTLYELHAAGLITLTNHQPDNRYSLLTIAKGKFHSLLTKLPHNDPGIQLIKLTSSSYIR
jgi:hypothetical protein